MLAHHTSTRHSGKAYTGAESASGKANTGAESSSGKANTGAESASGKPNTGAESASGKPNTGAESASGKGLLSVIRELNHPRMQATPLLWRVDNGINRVNKFRTRISSTAIYQNCTSRLTNNTTTPSFYEGTQPTYFVGLSSSRFVPERHGCSEGFILTQVPSMVWLIPCKGSRVDCDRIWDVLEDR